MWNCMYIGKPCLFKPTLEIVCAAHRFLCNTGTQSCMETIHGTFAIITHSSIAWWISKNTQCSNCRCSIHPARKVIESTCGKRNVLSKCSAVSRQLRRPNSCEATGANVRVKTWARFDGLNHFGVLFGKWGEKEGENISHLWPRGQSLTERQADKVVAHGRMQVSGEECFSSRIRELSGNLEGQANNTGLSIPLDKALHGEGSLLRPNGDFKRRRSHAILGLVNILLLILLFFSF